MSAVQNLMFKLRGFVRTSKGLSSCSPHKWQFWGQFHFLGKPMSIMFGWIHIFLGSNAKYACYSPFADASAALKNCGYINPLSRSLCFFGFFPYFNTVHGIFRGPQWWDNGTFIPIICPYYWGFDHGSSMGMGILLAKKSEKESIHFGFAQILVAQSVILL